MNVSPVRDALRLHRRQFVVGPDESEHLDGWRSIRVDSLWLSHCPELPVALAQDASGRAWALLGHAVATGSDDRPPIAQITGTPAGQFPSAYENWAGRWILIGCGQLHPDASARLGCYFATGPRGDLWASSSPALLDSLLKGNAGARTPGRLHYNVGISWYPPPQSLFEKVSRLLPSQVLDLEAGKVLPRPLMPAIDPSIAYDDRMAALRDRLQRGFRNLSRDGVRPWISLSAGSDSRMILAAAVLSGADARCFTRVMPRTSLADCLLPASLARAARLPHQILSGGERLPERIHIVRKHSAGNVCDSDAEPLLEGVRDSLDGFVIGGWSVSLGSGSGQRWRMAETFADPEDGCRQISSIFGEPLHSPVMPGLREWLQWVQSNPQAHLDWRARFHLEQRLAGWQSAKEQVYDLASVVRFPIFNCAHNYALVLGFPLADRVQKKHQKEFVRRYVPDLANFPYNPPDSYFGWHRVFARLARYPANTAQTVGRMLLRTWNSAVTSGQPSAGRGR